MRQSCKFQLLGAAIVNSTRRFKVSGGMGSLLKLLMERRCKMAVGTSKKRVAEVVGSLRGDLSCRSSILPESRPFILPILAIAPWTLFDCEFSRSDGEHLFGGKVVGIAANAVALG